MNNETVLSAADREQIEQHGLSEEHVRRQLKLLTDPPSGIELLRPAVVGDGVVQIEDARHGELLELYESAAAEGRFTKFVPASGAASRMFESLAAVNLGEASEEHQQAWKRWLRDFECFPFQGELADHLQGRGISLAEAVIQCDVTLLSALLDEEGLGYLRRPKGLVPFHRYREEVRTPFDEHLVEAAGHIRDREGRCRLHLTVLKQHEEVFKRHLEARQSGLERYLDASFDISFSFQEPDTDTVAVGLDGRPFRGRDGRLLIRPGGHGALIHNLGRLGADLVFIKNIDNVVPDGRRDVVILWKKLLGGYLLDLEQKLAPLDRPLRVCGVVPVAGEPGGGPFWVRDASGGESLQIVESSQIDSSQRKQAAILRRSTHFNPVDLLCRLRDHRGQPFDLERFVDPEAIFVADKSHRGRPLKTLEHPGLWNGAMAFWNTVFVEVPGTTFAPVKTVFDLLRDEHQA